MTSFGPLLREWCQVRQMSQLRLAEAAEVSTRHISFMETGRSTPSREMVLILASALDLPLRERNTLLGAAGFAAVYRETDLAAPAIPRRFARPRLGEEPQVVLSLHLRKAGRDLRMFTTLTTLGTPLDVTAQELRIESYFPADEETEEWVRSLET